MTAEQAEILGWFSSMLQAATKDGGAKRAAGTKPLWKVDMAHEAAIYSHLTKWKRGERIDPDSGAHPLVHLAWRALAIAWQETYNALETPDALDFVELRRKSAPTLYPANDEIAERLEQMARQGVGRVTD